MLLDKDFGFQGNKCIKGGGCVFMSIVRHFSRSGEIFFRYRSFLPFLVLPWVLVSLWGYSYPLGEHWIDLIWELFCFSVSLTGLFIRFWVSGTAPPGTSGRNVHRQKADELNTTGPYSIVRHPLYLGNYFVFLGLCLFTRDFVLIFTSTLLFILYYERIIFREEEFLKMKFGRDFLRWAINTPGIIPNFSLYRPAKLPFSWKAAIRREFHSVFLITTLFFLFEVVSDYVVMGRFVLDPVWFSLFILGAIFYIGVRMVKRFTHFFHTPDR